MTQEKQTIIAFVETCLRPTLFEYEQSLGGYVLRSKGKWVEQEQDNQGKYLDQWAIDNIPPASNVIMVWEGVCENSSMWGHVSDWSPSFEGKWRMPTADELQSLIEEPKQ